MLIHKEGFGILATSFAVVVLVIVALVYFTKLPSFATLFVSIALLLVFGFMLWFFRNPERNYNYKSLEVAAPVDGKVVEIKKVYEKEFLKKEVWQVSIFMSPLNVHVCRYPVSGKVVYTKYHPGKYLVAFHPKSSELNERTTVVVEAENKQNVLFRQIAGAVARRIVLYSELGNSAVAGKEYGFIKFGSRLDVFLPLDAEILVKNNQITVGGIDKIAILKQQLVQPN